jgi:pimeloyl-ACP methyl ester carboxylesterase
MITSLITCILISVILFFALDIQPSNYDVLPFKFKQYGDLDKPCIIIVPGLDGATAFFQDIIPELTVNFNVIVYYLPLKTMSMDSKAYTFEYIASGIVPILDELKISKASLVGESFGGIISQYFALLHSNRVESLVLLSSLAYTDLPPQIMWKANYLLPIVQNLGKLNPKAAQQLFASLHASDVVEENESDYVKNLFIKEASVAHFHSVMARIRLAMALDIRDQVKSIQSPIMIVYGADDHFTKKDSLLLKELILNSCIKQLPGGHLAHISSPKEFSLLVTTFVTNVISKGDFC